MSLSEFDSSDDDDLAGEEDVGFFIRIKEVLSNPYYVLLCIGLTGLYYIITGI